jgi:hypothetical protein
MRTQFQKNASAVSGHIVKTNDILSDDGSLISYRNASLEGITVRITSSWEKWEKWEAELGIAMLRYKTQCCGTKYEYLVFPDGVLGIKYIPRDEKKSTHDAIQNFVSHSEESKSVWETNKDKVGEIIEI